MEVRVLELAVKESKLIDLFSNRLEVVGVETDVSTLVGATKEAVFLRIKRYARNRCVLKPCLPVWLTTVGGWQLNTRQIAERDGKELVVGLARNFALLSLIGPADQIDHLVIALVGVGPALYLAALVY